MMGDERRDEWTRVATRLCRRVNIGWWYQDLIVPLITRAGWPLWPREQVAAGFKSDAPLARKKKVKPEAKKIEMVDAPKSSSESRKARFERSKRRR